MNRFFPLIKPLVILAILVGVLVVLIVVVDAAAQALCIDNLPGCLESNWGFGSDLAEFTSIFLGVAVVATFPLLVTILLIWVERKVSARFADRVFWTAKKSGAQTEEANVNAGLAAARQIVGFFERGEKKFIVNP